MGTLGVGIGIAWAASLAVAAAVVVVNPWFVDSLPWFAAFFYGASGAAGLLLGAALLPLRRAAPVRALGRHRGVLLLAPIAGGLALWGYSASRGYEVRDDRPKVVVIGLDGATYDIVDPMIAEGRLPSLARLIEGGAAGELRSIEPTISPALWTTMATGKLRSRHGVINFRSIQSALRAKRFWDIAGDAGLGIGMMDWLVTWPPPAAVEHGFWVPSHMARGPETVPGRLGFLQRMLGATRNHREATAIERLGWGIDALRSGVRLSTLAAGIGEAVRGVVGPDGVLERSYRLQHVALRIYLDLFLALRHEYRPDVAAVVFYGTDALAHKYWRYFEPAAFGDTDAEDVARYGSVIPDYYAAADRALGEIVRSTDENTTVFVVSDHGSQAMEGGQELRMPRLAGNSLVEALGVAEHVDVTGIGNQTIITYKAGAAAGDAFDLASVARLLNGATLDGADAEPFVVELADNEGIAGDYVGVSFNLATRRVGPDAFEATLRFPGDRSVRLADIVASDFPVSGGHHLRGIAILNGRGVRAEARIRDASLPDVAPTVLYLLGLPVGLDMDGKVLLDALDPAWVSAHPLRAIASYGGPGPAASDAEDAPMTPELEARLRALGYLTE
jgi:hypothetical protein